MKKIIIAYVPALHQGYISFLQSFSDRLLYLVSDEILTELGRKKPYYGRDIRALPANLMQKAVAALDLVREVRLLDSAAINELRLQALDIVAPDEDISLDLKNQFFKGSKMKLVSTFLRWDKKISEKEYQVSPDRIISHREFDRGLIHQARIEGEKSSDWWRQIGAVAVKGSQVILTGFNQNLPRPDNPNVLGDPRSNFNAGVRIDLVTTIHAEAAVVAQAANRGISLSGGHLYTTTFPCPPCARLIIGAGIKKLYYAKGYSLLDSEELLKNVGVEIILVV